MTYGRRLERRHIVWRSIGAINHPIGIREDVLKLYGRSPHILPWHPAPGPDEVFLSWLLWVADGNGVSLRQFLADFGVKDFIEFTDGWTWHAADCAQRLAKMLSKRTSIPISVIRRTLISELAGVIQTDLADDGYLDAFRSLHPGETGQFTFWDYFRRAFEYNRGIRIDHFLLSSQAGIMLKECEIDKGPRAEERPSDHAPIFIELAAPNA